jgi:hypothetical protein
MAESFAEPIPVSVAWVVPRVAKRLGYVRVGICQHCTDAVVVWLVGTVWSHRDTGQRVCEPARRRAPEPARMPAMVEPMTDHLDSETRQRVTSAGGRGRALALTPEERAESARTAANSAHRPANLARRIVKAWPSLSRAERAEVREVLRGGSVIP